MSYGCNIYYSPESHGLEEIFEEDTGESYEFSKFVVWVDASKGLYYATDAGCSCPSPFEDFNTVNDLTFASSPESVVRAFSEWWGSNAVAADRLRTALGNL